VDCVNLLARFGRDYRVTFDPAYDHRHVPRAKLDPWAMQLPCRRGVTIYPYGGDRLAVEVDRHRHVAKQLREIAGVTLYQDGDGEKTFLFDVGLFDAVAAVVKPKPRRKATEKQRAALAAGRFVFKSPG
jgi:hypothetical protein